MTPHILCNIFMFDLHQRIILVQKDGQMKEIAIANLDNLSEIIADACAQYKLNKVHLIGNHEYADTVATDIRMRGAAKYGNNYLEVEIN